MRRRQTTDAGKLTHDRSGRQLSVKPGGKCCRRLVALLGLILCQIAVSGVKPTSVWHPIVDIAQVAEGFIRERTQQGAAKGRTTIKAGMLDTRLRLAACDEALEPFLRPGTKIGPKTIVGVRCNGNKAWKMYVPVQVAVHETILVARHPMPRGHLIAANNIVSDERDVSRMNSGYIVRTEALVGQRLRQAVLSGRALTMQLIEADKVVRRGQTVTLSISAAGMTIRMAGKALMDGALEQRIRVENLNSGRIIEGIVRSPELVEILPPTVVGHRSASRNSFHAKPKVSPIPVDTELSNNDR